MANLMCEIFGHKFIKEIVESKWYMDIAHRYELSEVVCKRCGIKLSQINKKQ